MAQTYANRLSETYNFTTLSSANTPLLAPVAAQTRTNLGNAAANRGTNDRPHPMKLQPDRLDTLSVTAHGPGWVAINGVRHETSLVLQTAGKWEVWPCCKFEDLSAAHFAGLADTHPELVIFGSGKQLRFPKPEWIRPLIERNIGIETMDTAAACRTYNILAGEGRRVTAAFIVESDNGSPAD
jgi:uncharacterized protein